MTIKILGVGDAGISTLNLISDENLPRIELVAINTNAQSLLSCKGSNHLQIGSGLGRQAAEHGSQQIVRQLASAEKVIIVSRFGSGTGTGASPVIARLAVESGVGVIAVVSQPFTFEGLQRQQIAQTGIEKLKTYTDAVVTVPINALLHFAADKKPPSLQEAYSLAGRFLAWNVLTHLM